MPILPPAPYEYDSSPAVPEPTFWSQVPSELLAVGGVAAIGLGFFLIRHRAQLSRRNVGELMRLSIVDLHRGRYVAKAGAALALLSLIFPPWIGWGADGVRYYLGRMPVWQSSAYGLYIDFGRLFLQIVILSLASAVGQYGAYRAAFDDR